MKARERDEECRRTPSAEREWRRIHGVKMNLTARQKHDLEQISAAWGVTLSTAAWAITEDFLARCRDQAPNYGRDGLAIAAGVAVLRQRAAQG